MAWTWCCSWANWIKFYYLIWREICCQWLTCWWHRTNSVYEMCHKLCTFCVKHGNFSEIFSPFDESDSQGLQLWLISLIEDFKFVNVSIPYRWYRYGLVDLWRAVQFRHYVQCDRKRMHQTSNTSYKMLLK